MYQQYTLWKYWNILPQRLDIVEIFLAISIHFDTKNYA